MKNFLPFLILVSLVALTGLSIHNLNKEQNSANTANLAALDDEVKDNNGIDDGIHFFKTHITLPDFSLPTLYDESKTFSKKDLLGHYSVINLFASWCTTCRAEHDILLRLKDTGIVKLYGIAWRDIDMNTKHFLAKAGNPFDIVATDSKAIFSPLIKLNSVPETLIIDPKGNVVMRYRGNLQEFSIDEISAFLKKQKR